MGYIVASFHANGIIEVAKHKEIRSFKYVIAIGGRCFSISYGIADKPAALLFGADLITSFHSSSVTGASRVPYMEGSMLTHGEYISLHLVFMFSKLKLLVGGEPAIVRKCWIAADLT